ncbi:hypothetical protein BDZ91DRAFT_791154 [Kalaharituber pfeilii]|nr:hypothetical protein BDZ91DRAFT_791154 [Kalaharituber pfeilii]
MPALHPAVLPTPASGPPLPPTPPTPFLSTTAARLPPSRNTSTPSASPALPSSPGGPGPGSGGFFHPHPHSPSLSPAAGAAAATSAPTLASLLASAGALQEWKYEYRREAQQMVPWLWLGPVAATRNKEWLAARGITLLLAVRSPMTAKRKANGRLRDRRTPFAASNSRPSFDPSAPLTPQSTTTPSFTNTSPRPPYRGCCRQPHHCPLRLPRSTLVFCESGNEKSAVVVASYLMQHFGASVIQAVQIVQGKRFSVGFDDSMKFALTAYEPIWRSWREVQGVMRSDGRNGAGSNGDTGSGIKKKRGMKRRGRERRWPTLWVREA